MIPKSMIFKEGYLSYLVESKFKGEKIDKLDSGQVERVSIILGHLSKKYNLYDLLFKQPPQRIMVGDQQVNTRDLRMFVLMDHKLTRGYFMKFPGKTACTDTHMCQGVPLAFYGAKRVYDKPYSKWLEDIDLENKDSIFECDIFLPSGLSSLDIDDNTGEIVPSKTYGLITLIKHNKVFTPEIVQQLRVEVPNWVSNYTPKRVNEDCINDGLGIVYNKCAHKLRALILQGWIWNYPNSDMITDIFDWDITAARIGYQGLPVQVGGLSGGILKFMNENSEELKKHIELGIIKDDLVL